jgi:hypothetical protein
MVKQIMKSAAMFHLRTVAFSYVFKPTTILPARPSPICALPQGTVIMTYVFRSPV